MEKIDWSKLDKDQKTHRIRLLTAGSDMTAADIAAHFTNVTRNAIISHMRRYDVRLPNALPPDKKRLMPPRVKSKSTRLPPRAPIGNTGSYPVRKIDIVFDESKAMPFLDAVDQKKCRWPLWGMDQTIGMCCGQDVMERGKPYCAGHHALSRTSRYEPDPEAAKVKVSKLVRELMLE